MLKFYEEVKLKDEMYPWQSRLIKSYTQAVC
jgi:hypothetical protein